MLKQLSNTAGKFKGASHEEGGIDTMNGIPVGDQLSPMANIEVEGEELINTTPEGFTISPKDDPLNPEIERLNIEKGMLEDKLTKQSIKMAKAFDKRIKKKNDKELDDREKNTLEFLQSDSGLAKKIEALDQQIQSLVAQQEQSIPDTPELANDQEQILAKNGYKMKAGYGMKKVMANDGIKAALKRYYDTDGLKNRGKSGGIGNVLKTGAVDDSNVNIKKPFNETGFGKGLKQVGQKFNKMLDDPNALATIGDLTSVALDASTDFQAPQAPVQQRTINANLDPISQAFASAQDRLAQESATLGAGIQGASRSATENNAALIRAGLRSGISDLAIKEAEALAQESSRAQTINAGIDEGNVQRLSQFQDASTRFINELSQRRTSRLQRIGDITSANRAADLARSESFTNLAGQDPQAVLALFENNVQLLADTYFKGDTKQAQRYLESLRKQVKG